jgi:hypothetical protein
MAVLMNGFKITIITKITWITRPVRLVENEKDCNYKK